MKIKRREILEAIRTEKLLAGGSFIHGRKDSLGNRIIDRNCKVCAVGALLRLKGIDSDLITLTAHDITGDYGLTQDSNEFEALKKKQYINALSIRFERLYEKQGAGKKTRETLARFVKRHFPKEIRV
jgi:hypothetical protein